MHKALCNSNIQWLHQRREDWRGSARGTRAKPAEGSSKPREAFKPARYDCAASSSEILSQDLCRPSPTPQPTGTTQHVGTCPPAPTRLLGHRTEVTGWREQTKQPESEIRSEKRRPRPAKMRVRRGAKTPEHAPLSHIEVLYVKELKKGVCSRLTSVVPKAWPEDSREDSDYFRNPPGQNYLHIIAS